MGTTCVVKYTNVAKDYKVTTADGKTVKAKRISNDEISFPTVAGGEYIIVSTTPNAIAAVTGSQEGTIATVCYYSLNGAKTNSTPSRGVYIKQTKYSNGTTATTKVIN